MDVLFKGRTEVSDGREREGKGKHLHNRFWIIFNTIKTFAFKGETLFSSHISNLFSSHPVS